LFVKQFNALKEQVSKESKFKSVVGSTVQKLPAQSGLVKVEFLSIPYALTLTILAAQLRQFTEFSELKFGSLKAKLFLDRNKLPLNQLKTVNVEIVTVNANPVADNNNVVVNSLKTAPMKPSQCSIVSGKKLTTDN
jgi:hypothetical protein